MLGLSKGLPQITPIKNLNLELEAGRRYLLLGANGSGKTTFLRLLNGALLPQTGNITFHRLSPTAQLCIRPVIGTASGNPRGFLWRLTVKENFDFFMAIAGLNPQTSQKKLRSYLNQLELPELYEQPHRTLSAGQKQVMSVLRAILMEPEILILDETMERIAPKLRRQIRELILREQEIHQFTLFLATHDHEEARTFGEQAIEFKPGPDITLRSHNTSSSYFSTQTLFKTLVGKKAC